MLAIAVISDLNSGFYCDRITLRPVVMSYFVLPHRAAGVQKYYNCGKGLEAVLLDLTNNVCRNPVPNIVFYHAITCCDLDFWI